MSILHHPVDGNVPIDANLGVDGIFVVTSIIISWVILHFPVDPVGNQWDKIISYGYQLIMYLALSLIR